MLYKLVRRCVHCKKEMQMQESAYSQNPYCTDCLPERLREASENRKDYEWESRGDYSFPIKKVR